MLKFLVYKWLLLLLVGELKTTFYPAHCSQILVVSIVSWGEKKKRKSITGNIFSSFTAVSLERVRVLTKSARTF